jgi:hypothetical protein
MNNVYLSTELANRKNRIAPCERVARFAILLLAGFVSFSAISSANAATIYSNGFETDANGFTNLGVLPSLTRTSLPTDGGGLASANQSTWLGRLGQGIGKTSANQEIVNLTVGGLTPGEKYRVGFDLLIGASWDGAAVGYGYDGWFFSVDGTKQVDTLFSNGNQGSDYGAYSPQRYSDSSFSNPNGPDVSAFTGAEFFRKEGPGYSGYYGIYYFSHGAGNPDLTFIATGTSVTLAWARFSGPQNFGDSSDEYWALDNVFVSTVPEVSSIALTFSGLAALTGCGYLRRKRS